MTDQDELLVADSGHVIEGLVELIANSAPASIRAVVAESSQEAALETLGTTFADSIDGLEAGPAQVDPLDQGKEAHGRVRLQGEAAVGHGHDGRALGQGLEQR